MVKFSLASSTPGSARTPALDLGDTAGTANPFNSEFEARMSAALG